MLDDRKIIYLHKLKDLNELLQEAILKANRYERIKKFKEAKRKRKLANRLIHRIKLVEDIIKKKVQNGS